MSLKKGGGPKTIPATLTVIGQGSTDKLNVIYHNRKASELKSKFDGNSTMAGVIPYIVESWDSDFEVTEEGVTAFEDEYPGIIDVLLEGYHKARGKAIEKN